MIQFSCLLQLQVQADGMPSRFWQLAYHNNQLYVFGANFVKSETDTVPQRNIYKGYYENRDVFGMLNLETNTWTKLYNIEDDDRDLDRKTMVIRLPYEPSE